MPIFVNDYEWHQHGPLVTLKIGLRDFISKPIDITLTSSYIKVNFAPYIFEAFLLHKIDANSSSSQIKDGELHFKLIKALNQEWESFDIKSNKKEESQKLRIEALEEFQQLQISKFHSKQENVRNLSRLAISKQIEINEEKHSNYKKKLKEETNNFFNESVSIEEKKTQDENKQMIRKRFSSTCSEDSSCITSEGDYDGDEECLYHSSFENIPALANPNILSKKTYSRTKERDAGKQQSPRESVVIKIQHSTHKEGVPKRRSASQMKVKVNDVILSLNEENNVKKDFSSDTKTEKSFQKEENGEESTYDIKKREAAQKFVNEEHMEAIRLYSIIIEMMPQDASNYSNRAASYLKLKFNKKAVKDCTKALSLLVPHTKDNLKSRLLCFIRRGYAFALMRNYEKSLIDYKAALELEPNNDKVMGNVHSINLFLNTSSDTGEEEDVTDTLRRNMQNT